MVGGPFDGGGYSRYLCPRVGSIVYEWEFRNGQAQEHHYKMVREDGRLVLLYRGSYGERVY